MAFRHGAESIRRATAACGLAIIAIAFGSLAISQDRPLYQLGAGDVVEVIVAGEPDLSAPGPGGVTVGPDGRIGLPHAGMINVEGLTCEEAASRIADALTPDILVDPEVLVRVIEFRSRAIFVIGEVKTPGVFPHAPGLTVRRAVALAGGVAIDPSGPPSRISGRIVRSDGSLVDVALGDALRGDDDAGDLPMEPGDTLVVLVETDLAATVLGAVASPGTYVPPRGARLTDLVAMAGGPTGTADINNVTVQRSRDETITCDLAAAMAGDGDNNPAIEPGDLIYVPTITRAASIIGNVQDPGKYEFAEGDRVSSLLAQAKGVMRGDEAGDLSNITVVRADGTIVDVDLAQANAAADPLLQPGDLVIVPETDLFITVTGHVVNAGRYRFNVGDTARTAIAYAGGVDPLYGATHAALIRRRDGTELSVDTEIDDPELIVGDEVTVPRSVNRVAVIGYVRTPGLYDFQEGDTVIDVVAMAGGWAPPKSDGYRRVRGNPSRAFLYREVDGVEVADDLNLHSFYKRGDVTANPVVQPGDIIVVPGKGKVDASRILRDVLSIPRSLRFLWSK